MAARWHSCLSRICSGDLRAMDEERERGRDGETKRLKIRIGEWAIWRRGERGNQNEVERRDRLTESFQSRRGARIIAKYSLSDAKTPKGDLIITINYTFYHKICKQKSGQVTTKTL